MTLYQFPQNPLIESLKQYKIIKEAVLESLKDISKKLEKNFNKKSKNYLNKIEEIILNLEKNNNILIKTKRLSITKISPAKELDKQIALVNKIIEESCKFLTNSGVDKQGVARSLNYPINLIIKTRPGIKNFLDQVNINNNGLVGSEKLVEEVKNDIKPLYEKKLSSVRELLSRRKLESKNLNMDIIYKSYKGLEKNYSDKLRNAYIDEISEKLLREKHIMDHMFYVDVTGKSFIQNKIYQIKSNISRSVKDLSSIIHMKEELSFIKVALQDKDDESNMEKILRYSKLVSILINSIESGSIEAYQKKEVKLREEKSYQDMVNKHRKVVAQMKERNQTIRHFLF